MPLPLFFHLAVILRRKLELVKLLVPSLCLIPRLTGWLYISHSACEARVGCFHPGEWIENGSDLCTPSVQWAISSQAVEATSSGVTGQVIPQ